jgi:hypothetical protein
MSDGERPAEIKVRTALPAIAERRPAPAAAGKESPRTITARPVAANTTPRRRLPKPVRLAAHILAGFALAACFALSLLYGLLLVRGQIALPFMVRPLEHAINGELDGLSVRIGGAHVQQSGDGRGFELRLARLSVLDAEGRAVAHAPLAAVSLSGRAALRGQIAPASIDLIGPSLDVVYAPREGLSLSFGGNPQPSQPGVGPVSGPPSSERPADGGATPTREAPRPLDLARTIAEALARARQGDEAAHYLRELGIRDALVRLHHAGQRSEWRVPGFTIDLHHGQKRSTVAGQGQIASTRGPWGLRFRTEESQKSKRLAFEAEVAELVPRTLADNLPELSLLRLLEMPIAGTARLDLSSEGELQSADLRLTLAAGRVLLPWLDQLGIAVEGGTLDIGYSKQSGTIEVRPSSLSWRGGKAGLGGSIAPVTLAGGRQAWRFDLALSELGLAGQGGGTLALDGSRIAGLVDAAAGTLTLERVALMAGGAEIALAGQFADTPAGIAVRLGGEVGSVPLEVLRRLWPPDMLPEARDWVEVNVSRATITRGRVHVDLRPGQLEQLVSQRTAPPPGAMTATLELGGLEFRPQKRMPRMIAESARLHADGRRLEITLPQARVPLPSGRQVAVREGQLAIPDILATPPTGEIGFQATAAAAAALELTEQEPFAATKALGIEAGAVEGKAEARFKVTVPMVDGVELRAMRIEGRARVTELRVKGAAGGQDVRSDDLSIAISEKALDAKGGLLVGGVNARLAWQRIFGAAAGKQPPMRVTAVLDAADRDALGLAVNHMLLGSVPVVATVHPEPGGPPAHIEADLSGAELILEALSWRKPPGRPLMLRSDVARGRDGRTELQNFKLAGGDLGVDGWIALDARNQLRAFDFPEVALNVITKLSLKGRMREDGVLEVKAEGRNYDGKPFFRALLSADALHERPTPPGRARSGLDLVAEIDNVLGFNETSLKGVRIVMKRRGDKMVELEGGGHLSGSGAPLTVSLAPSSGPRVLAAETTDAGTAFRLVNFFPSVRGGEARLEVNLDGKGHAAKTGILAARRFVVLGDTVELYSPEGGAQRRYAREQTHFDELRAPFALGHGQFVLQESYLNGPLLGATVGGKIDFDKQSVALDGTYIPIYGINSIPNQVPVLGEILSGGKPGQGMFSIAFQVRGPLGRPQVLVNPFSIFAPGPFQELLSPGSRSVQPRAQPAAPAVPPKSSSLPAITEEQAQAAEERGGALPVPGAQPQASSSEPQRGGSEARKAGRLPRRPDGSPFGRIQDGQ